MSNPDLNSKRLPPVPTSSELDEPSLPELSAIGNQGGPSTVPQSTDVISSLGEFRFYKPTENTFSKPNPGNVLTFYMILTKATQSSLSLSLCIRRRPRRVLRVNLFRYQISTSTARRSRQSLPRCTPPNRKAAKRTRERSPREIPNGTYHNTTCINQSPPPQSNPSVLPFF